MKHRRDTREEKKAKTIAERKSSPRHDFGDPSQGKENGNEVFETGDGVKENPSPSSKEKVLATIHEEYSMILTGLQARGRLPERARCIRIEYFKPY